MVNTKTEQIDTLFTVSWENIHVHHNIKEHLLQL